MIRVVAPVGLKAQHSMAAIGTALTKARLDPSPALRDPAIAFASELPFSQFRHQCRIFNIDGFSVEEVAQNGATLRLPASFA